MLVQDEIEIIPLSVIIPTYNRCIILERTLLDILKQTKLPGEVIIIDASERDDSKLMCEKVSDSYLNVGSKLIYLKAKEKGAAKQRNFGVEKATNTIIGFCDDDIILQENCIGMLWTIINMPECGGVNAVITNQKYHPIGIFSKMFYALITGKIFKDYSGKCIGPLICFLPDDKKNCPDFIEVEWLNTTCTLYKKKILPEPVFDIHFTGYSLMEDLCLSLRVRKKYKLYNACNARIYHDSQPSQGKSNTLLISEMDLVNRYYILKKVLKRNWLKNLFQLSLQQLFSLLTTRKIFNLDALKGKINGIRKIRSI